MAKRPSAGDLIEAVAFDKRVEENPDSPVDYGNTLSSWQEQFMDRAKYMHLRGGEAVIASRLQGRHVQVIRCRSHVNTLAVTTEWRVRDTRTEVEYAIRDITPSDDRQWLDFLVESGVAA